MNRDADVGIGPVDIGREWDELGDWDLRMCTAMCKTDSQWEAAVQHREISSVLCGDLDGWDGGWEGGPRGRGYVYTYS